MKTHLLALTLSLVAVALVNPLEARAGERIGEYGRGSIQTVNGLPVLKVEGSPREMGIQYGALAGDRVAESLKVVEEIAQHDGKEYTKVVLPRWLIRPLRRGIGWAFWQLFPREVRKEIDGIVEGAGRRKPAIRLNRYDIAFLNSLVDLVGMLHSDTSFIDPGRGILKELGLDRIRANCNSFAAWGSRTEGGKTFQTRNVDLPTGLGLERVPLVIVYKPNGRIPYVTASFAGLVGVFTGLNASGVGLGQVWGFSEIRSLGVPWTLQMKQILSRATTAKQAVELFGKENRMTYGNNFVLADSTGDGYAVETTPRHFSVFGPNDPREYEAMWNGEVYGIPLHEAVFRGDAALDPRIRKHQTASNGPDGDPREAGAYRKRYKGQADRIVAYEEAGVLIGKEQAETISRETAIRNGSLQAAVYGNSDLDLWVSYARVLPDGKIQQAYEGEYVHIPFAELLKEGSR